MLFLVYHQDREGAQEIRRANRPAHLEYVKGYPLLIGGPTLSDDGESMTGTLIVVDLPDLAAAEAFVAGDPYVKAGLFQTTIVKRWRKVLPAD